MQPHPRARRAATFYDRRTMRAMLANICIRIARKVCQRYDVIIGIPIPTYIDYGLMVLHKNDQGRSLAPYPTRG